MTRSRPSLSISLAIVVLALGALARADDAFYEVSRKDLKITDGQWPERGFNQWPWRSDMSPYAMLDHEGEAYFLTPAMVAPNRRRMMENADIVLVVRAPEGREVRGKLFVPDDKRAAMVPLPFVIPPDAASPDARQKFLEARLVHYENLLSRDIPGGAWWRHRGQQAAAALGEQGREIREQLPRRPARDLDDTFALFTGGKAVSENLQLDRALRLRPGRGDKAIDVNTIRGITVREFDWKPLVKDAKPEVDPLASLIPADQHAVFIPSFDAAARLIDEGMLIGTEALNFAEPVSEDAMTLRRYQEQLCLPLTTVGRIAGPRLVNSIAVTGSDPYFRVGTDVAVIFEAKDATALRNLLAAQLAAARQGDPGAKVVSGTVAGLAYNGAVSADRSICAYIATVGDAVVVTNSLAQLEQLVNTREGKRPSLASLAEYTFFRDRYRRGDGEEAALMILSDATIRRWCGPRWRIADSRRTRAAAALSALQAEHHDAILAQSVEPGLLSQNLIEGEDIRLQPHGVISSTFGDLGFMTPIAELHVDQVTEAERDSYERWRDTYQQNWRNYFDPIAVRIATNDDKLAMDVTVMPLIASTDYAMMVDLTRGARLAPGAGDPHDALAHFVLAIDRDSGMMKSVSSFGRGMFKVDLLSWIGDSASIYVDPDPYWEALAKKAQENEERIDVEAQMANLPLAVRIDNRDSLKLTAFLVALRAYIEQSAPANLLWETRRHNDTPYVRVTPTPRAQGNVGAAAEPVAIHYVALPDALTICMNENVIRNVIDRHASRDRAEREPAPAGAKQEAAAGSRPWLGSNVALRMERPFIDILGAIGNNDYQRHMQRRSWANLPILNEYRRLYPDRDPVRVYEQLWGIRLVCPAGGQYVFNDRYKTMESTVLGHPAGPKAPPTITSPVLDRFSSAEFGLDFEHDGLRARGILWRAAARK